MTAVCQHCDNTGIELLGVDDEGRGHYAQCRHCDVIPTDDEWQKLTDDEWAYWTIHRPALRNEAQS